MLVFKICTENSWSLTWRLYMHCRLSLIGTNWPTIISLWPVQICIILPDLDSRLSSWKWIPGGCINWRCRAARSRIWPLRRPIGENEALRHATVVVGSSAPTLRKSLRPWGQLRNCLLRQLLAGGECPALERWWRESKKSNKPLKLPGMYAKGAKTAGFTHFLT
jgi:hypothetical protein